MSSKIDSDFQSIALSSQQLQEIEKKEPLGKDASIVATLVSKVFPHCKSEGIASVNFDNTVSYTLIRKSALQNGCTILPAFPRELIYTLRCQIMQLQSSDFGSKDSLKWQIIYPKLKEESEAKSSTHSIVIMAEHPELTSYIRMMCKHPISSEEDAEKLLDRNIRCLLADEVGCAFDDDKAILNYFYGPGFQSDSESDSESEEGDISSDGERVAFSSDGERVAFSSEENCSPPFLHK